jgi:hypothetical protein
LKVGVGGTAADAAEIELWVRPAGRTKENGRTKAAVQAQSDRVDQKASEYCTLRISTALL